jgi:DNA-binding ferritin-like protein
MNLESLVSQMMHMTVVGRLWHWTTDNAQHHVTYENFLTQNDNLVDSVVESALGNDMPINFSSGVGVQDAKVSAYSVEASRKALMEYRQDVVKFQEGLADSDSRGSTELATILDDVVELCSKTLYMLRLK